MQEIHYPMSDQVPATGTLLEVIPGICWARMPLPFALNHINLWLLKDSIDGQLGWTVVDTGIANDETRQAWETLMATQLGGLPILRVLVTHMHPDHIGLADWLAQKASIPIWMSLSDYSVARWLTSAAGAEKGSQAGGGGAAEHFKRHGLCAEDDLTKIRARAGYYREMVPSIPVEYVRLMDGDSLKIGQYQWQVIVGYGHAPEHLSFWSPDLDILISGDMVLPRISTNVSVYDSEPSANPLKLYLDSLKKLERLPQHTYVLPSHGKPFTGLHQRLNALSMHHQERLAQTLLACENKHLSARELVPILFRRQLDLHQLTFAMGEAIAHLNYLWLDGRLLRELCSDGVLRFSSR